jgi:maleate cis-trans isomerase
MADRDVLVAPPQQIRFDDGAHARAKIGYVLLATEQTVQDDVMRLRPPGVGVHFTRAAIADSITSESLAAQADLLADCAATLLPDGSLDVVCYACTSGSLVIGEERVFAEQGYLADQRGNSRFAQARCAPYRGGDTLPR